MVMKYFQKDEERSQSSEQKALRKATIRLQKMRRNATEECFEQDYRHSSVQRPFKVWVEGSGNYPAHRLGQLGLNLQITCTESLQLLKVLFSDKSKFSIHADLLNGVRNSNQCPDFRFHQNMKSKTKQLPTERIFFPGEDFSMMSARSESQSLWHLWDVMKRGAGSVDDLKALLAQRRRKHFGDHYK